MFGQLVLGIVRQLSNLCTLISRDVAHSPAIQQEPVALKVEQQPSHTNEIGRGLGLGF